MSIAIRSRAARSILRAAVVAAAVAAALPAAAQTAPPRPVTGRHAPPRVGRPPTDWSAEAGPWSFTVGAGLLTSGDLFRVVVPDGSARIWSPPLGGTFNAHEFLVTLDEDLAVSATVGRQFGSRWRARCDVSWGEADATAEARTGQTVELYAWERPAFLLAALDVECRLVHARLFPYALAGMSVTRLSAAKATALDQTRLGLRGGVGLQYGFAPEWGMRAELRDTWQQFDMSEYGDDPAFADFEFEELGPQHLFELLLQIYASF